MKLVAENFVPVALNTDRLTDSEDGKFFRALMKQWPQGLWVVTPDGKVLGFHYHKPKPGENYAQGQQRWADETVQMVRAAVKDAGPLAAREVKARPDPLATRGRGTTGGGGARLAVSVIALQSGRQEGPPVVDSIHLNAEQWAAFQPPAGAAVGREWALPEETGRRFAPALSPMTDPIFSPAPADAKAAKLTAKVERVAEGVAVVRFNGQWETAHNRDGDAKYPIRTTATGEGVGIVDARTGKLTAMVWVLNGSYRNSPPGDKPRPTVAVVEWSAR